EGELLTVHALRRAHQQVLIRRRWRQLEQLLEETEHRCELLLEASRDAIAYVHEGMHIYANEAYRELFGYDDMDELSCMPLVDLVHTQNADDLKRKLKEVSEGKPTSFSAIGEHESGGPFDATLDISTASYEGESCLQIVIRKAAVDNTALQDQVREMAT
ncbi:MAG: PAS domain-containing protein, partial [Natronospirillum sp.]